jgi:hypothetical protein
VLFTYLSAHHALKFRSKSLSVGSEETGDFEMKKLGLMVVAVVMALASTAFAQEIMEGSDLRPQDQAYANAGYTVACLAKDYIGPCKMAVYACMQAHCDEVPAPVPPDFILKIERETNE